MIYLKLQKINVHKLRDSKSNTQWPGNDMRGEKDILKLLGGIHKLRHTLRGAEGVEV